MNMITQTLVKDDGLPILTIDGFAPLPVGSIIEVEYQNYRVTQVRIPNTKPDDPRPVLILEVEKT